MHVELSSSPGANIEILNKVLLTQWAAFHREQANYSGLLHPEPAIIRPDLETIQAVEKSKGEKISLSDSKNDTHKTDLATILGFLKDTELCPLSEREHLRGTRNVNYFIFYKGDFPLYSEIDLSTPLYAGKAIGFYPRIGNHQKSISSVEAFAERNRISNIKLSDFYYRFIPVTQFNLPGWEAQLIDYFKPYWNKKLRGFGNKPTCTNMSPWDRMHPGRPGQLKTKTHADDNKVVDIKATKNK